MDLLLYYFALPMLLSFLWFRNLVWLLQKLKQGQDIKYPALIGPFLTSAVVGSILLSIYLL